MSSASSSQPTPLTPAQLNYAEPSQWRQLIRQELTDARCSTPAFLTSDMDVAEQTVSVQVAIQERVRTPIGPQWWDLPPVLHVPILVPRGGGFSQTLPLKKGDEGMLIFCDCCFDQWWQNGQNNSPVPSNTGVASGSQRQIGMHRHEFWDCGFLPGMWSQPNVLSDYSADSMQLRADDGSAYVDVAENIVTISGGDQVSLVAPLVTVDDGSGTPQFLVTDTWYQWFVANIMPFLISKGYGGPGVPVGSETTVLKGQ